MIKLINGVRYHVDQCGNGFPLLLLHGFTAGASTWQPFCPVFGKHSRLIMVDLIGHGKSESPLDAERYNVIDTANDLLVLLDELGMEQIDLVGYSMGGRVAITFAALYPERVRKLVLESTTPGLQDAADREMRMKQDHILAKRIETEGLEKFVSYWEAIPLFQSQSNLPEQVREQIRSQRLSNNAAGLANSLRGMGTGSQPSWWSKLDKFQCETLLITGTLDEKFCRLAEKMAELIPNAKHLSINDAGHAIHVEQPEKFGTMVSEFLFNT